MKVSRIRSAVTLEWCALGIIMLAGLLLRTHEIGALSYSFDESSSWKTIGFSWPEMFRSISQNVHPPVFYVLLKCWAYLFGNGPVALRMFSVTFGVLSIWSAHWFLKVAGAEDRVTSSLPGVIPLFGAALVAISPAHVALGMQARMYTLGIFLAIVCATFVLRIVRSGGILLDWIGCTTTGVLLTLTHYYGLFTAAALGTVLGIRLVHVAYSCGWTPKLKRLLIGTSLGAWTAAIVWRYWLPIFLAQRVRVAGDYWIPDFQWADLSRTATVLFTGF